MNVFLYLIIFIMGITVGSFLTLATYRIPLNQDITHKRSYCPKCNHRLEFLDMIPLFSYIFLNGRCRYCHVKISPRYFIIELLSGVSFLILAGVLKIDVYTLNINIIIELFLGMLYIAFLFLMGGISLEHNKIDKRVLTYGFIISILEVGYQYFLNNKLNMNRIIIYLVLIGLLLLFSISKKGNEKVDNVVDIIIYCILINLFTYEITAILTIIFTLLIVSIRTLIYKIIKKGKKYNLVYPIAFYISISNAIVLGIIFLKSMVF